MKLYEGAGFQVSIPRNWMPARSASGMTTYFAAPDGKWEIEGGMTVALGMIAGFERAGVHDLKILAQDRLDSLARDNPGLRVLVQRPLQLAGREAFSFVFENPGPIRGELERTMMVITKQRDQAFFVTLTAPAVLFGELQDTFERVLASVQLR